MRIFLLSIALGFLLSGLGGCTSDCGKDEPLALAAPMALSAEAPCSCHPNSLGAPAGSGTPVLYGAASPIGAQNLAIAYGQPGGREYAKAAFAVPPAVIECVTSAAAEALQLVGRTAKCIVNGFFPTVEPSQRFVALKPVKAAEAPKAEEPAPAPKAADPCPKEPPPEPVASLDGCTGKNCRMPGR